MDPFVGEIRIFTGNFAPLGWALCNGQLLPISQNTALFSLLGTMYGGDGKSNFALPNLQGRAPLMFGQGPGLSPRSQGEVGGAAAVTLTSAQIPAHGHTVSGSASLGTTPAPGGTVWGEASAARGQKIYSTNPGTAPAMSPQAFGPTGGGQPHNNLPPYLVLNFSIALQGVFPARS